MEIVFYEDDRSIHGVLDRRLGYSIEARTKKGVTGYSDKNQTAAIMRPKRTTNEMKK